MKGLLRALLAGGALSLLLTAEAAAEAPFDGTYVVAALRAASGVAAPLPPPDAPMLPEIGAIVDFDRMTAWLDGDPCVEPASRLAPSLPLEAGDPILSDLQLILAGDGQVAPINVPYTFDCGGRALSSIKNLVQIDDRTLVWVTSNGSALSSSNVRFRASWPLSWRALWPLADSLQARSTGRSTQRRARPSPPTHSPMAPPIASVRG